MLRGRPCLLLDKPVSDGPCRRVSAGGDAKLVEDVADVATYRVRADDQGIGDFGVGLATGDEAEDFDLAFGEAVRVGGTSRARLRQAYQQRPRFASVVGNLK